MAKLTPSRLSGPYGMRKFTADQLFAHAEKLETQIKVSVSLGFATASIETNKPKLKMKILRLFAATAFVVTVVPFISNYGQDPDFKPPGTEENAAVDQANARLDAVYKRLMGKLDADGQKALKEAERSWIKWRDDEAMLIARVGGAVGGSGMRVDFANAQLKLINQRIEALSEYLKQSAGD
jgi:uncharacterized protein YecT (DUF1311 family)